jgi:hypothetical protein
VVQIGNKHGCRFDVKYAVISGFHLLEGTGIKGEARLRWAAYSAGLGTGPALAIAVKGHTTVFGVNGAVMAEKKIASNEGTATLHAFERTLLGVCRESVMCCEKIGPCKYEDTPSVL